MVSDTARVFPVSLDIITSQHVTILLSDHCEHTRKHVRYAFIDMHTLPYSSISIPRTPVVDVHRQISDVHPPLGSIFFIGRIIGWRPLLP